MIKGRLLVVACTSMVLASGAFVRAQEAAFEYPVYLVDAYDGDSSCWTGMDAHGVYDGPVRVIPEIWLIGPPLSEKSGVTLPPDHWVEVQFRGPIVDGPGDDIVLIELGPVNEEAHVYVTDGAGQEYLLGKAKADGEGIGVDPTVIKFDIAGLSVPFAPRAVRIVGLDHGGEAPGFDIGNVTARIGDDCGAVACNPVPVDGAKNVSESSVLSFSPGQSAVEHVVYLSADPETLEDSANRQDANSFDPNGLALGRTHYWRVDEVYETGVRPGPVWTFTTTDHLVVDDFESYELLADPSDLDARTIYDAWRNANIFASGERSRLCGRRSMGFNYYYSGSFYEEALYTFSPAQNWARAGVKVLELFFYGEQFNSPGQMYVVLNDRNSETILPYAGDAGDLLKQTWQPWRIKLDDVNGLDMSNIESLSIGFSTLPSDPFGSGTGTVYFDDITLYSSKCVEEDRPPADFDGDCCVGLPDLDEMAYTWLDTGHNTFEVAAPNDPVAWYKFDGDADDSAGEAHGTVKGEPNYVGGMYGQAISLDGTQNSVELSQAAYLFSSLIRGITIAFWQYGSGSPHRTDTLCCSNYSYGAENPVISVNLGCWRGPGEYNWDCGRPWSFDGRLSGDHRYESEWSGRWNHWAFTKDVPSGRMQIFLNGRLYDSRDGAYSPMSGIRSFEIGSGWYGAYDGLIDDFRIYDYALSQPEIAHAATNGTGVFDLPLLLPTDLSGDDRVDMGDFALFAESWLEDGLWP